MNLITRAVSIIMKDLDLDVILKNPNSISFDELQKAFISQTKWREASFTLSEHKLVFQYLRQYLKIHDSGSFNLHTFFNIFNDCISETYLTIENGKPVVKYENLVEWNEFRAYVEEDLFIAILLASKFKDSPKFTNNFDWNIPLGHNANKLNFILDDGLSEIHSHFNAACEIFNLFWLDFMNNFVKRHSDYKHVLTNNDLIINDEVKSSVDSFCYLIDMAAAIRFRLYEAITTDSIKKENFDKIFETAYSRQDMMSILNDLKGDVMIKAQQSLKTIKNSVVDYALNKVSGDNPYEMFSGERKLIYSLLKGYFTGKKIYKKLCNYLFCYILIKNKIRSAFIHNNSLVGISNFQNYNKNKNVIDSSSSYFGLYKDWFAIHTSIRKNTKDKLEARVSSISEIPANEEKICNSLFTGHKLLNLNNDNVTFVIHLLKENINRKDLSKRHKAYSDVYKDSLDKILDEIKKRESSIRRTKKSGLFRIVGLDAAGNELECEPEVFGHVYRAAKAKGLTNRTFHVGEDFYDLIDGLRNIDEAIAFLDLGKGSRLSHVLALGINPVSYYKRRNYQAIMPKQKLLDSLVWFLYMGEDVIKNKMSDKNRQILLDKIKEIYHEIGFSIEFDLQTYYHSQRLRSDDLSNSIGESYWSKSKLCQHETSIKARKNIEAKQLNEQYQLNEKIYDAGQEIIYFQYPIEIVDVIRDIQEIIIEEIKSKEITIECAPTSNIRIGKFRGYDEHPIWHFMESGLICTVNTDDKGIFLTSLSNEFSLLSQTKDKINSKWEKKLKSLIDNGFNCRFQTCSIK